MRVRRGGELEAGDEGTAGPDIEQMLVASVLETVLGQEETATVADLEALPVAVVD
jgi:hypothetical protein